MVTIGSFSVRMHALQQHAFLHCTGAFSAIAWAYLAFKSNAYASATVYDFLLVAGFCLLMCVLCWRHYQSEQRSMPVIAMLLWAIVFRLIGIQSFPVLEDDFFRFLWDGYQTVVNGTPYAAAPAEYFSSQLSDARFEAVLSNINYPELKTIYWPVTQWVFAAAYLIEPAESWPLQALLALFDVGVIVLLLALAPARNVLLYAWSPLVIKEFAFSAHPDVIGIFFILLALVLCRRHFAFMAVSVGLAIAAKPFALIVAPLLLRLHWRAWLLALMVIALVSVPFGVDVVNTAGGLQAMNQQWLFNAPGYLLASTFADKHEWLSYELVKMVLLGSFSLVWGFYFLRQLRRPVNERNVPRGDVLFSLFFLALPVLNPWYLVWLLPFAVVYPSLWAWVASAAVLLSYLTGLNTGWDGLGAYEIPMSIVLLEFTLICVAIGFDWTRNYLSFKR